MVSTYLPEGKIKDIRRGYDSNGIFDGKTIALFDAVVPWAWLRDLFDHNEYSQPIDLFFNLLMFYLPVAYIIFQRIRKHAAINVSSQEASARLPDDLRAELERLEYAGMARYDYSATSAIGSEITDHESGTRVMND